MKYLNGKRIVNRPVLVTYMFGPDATESESMSLTQLKNRGTANFCCGIFESFVTYHKVKNPLSSILFSKSDLTFTATNFQQNKICSKIVFGKTK